MKDPDDGLRRTAGWLLVLTVLFIVYASLYPFDFDLQRIRISGRADWARSFAWHRPPRSDLIANLLFYLPFGALTTYLAPREWPHLRRWLLALGAGTALSLLIECAQFATRDRDPALTDIVVNGLSAALASAAVLTARSLGVRPALPELRAHRPDPIALLLVGLWLAFHAAPFMPTARFLRYFRDADLLFGQQVEIAAVAGYAAGYIILGTALRNLLRPSSFWPVMIATACVSLGARIAFRGQRLELAECLGLLLALPVIWRLMSSQETRAFVVAGMGTCITLVVFMLAPFDFSAPAARFAEIAGLPVAHRTAAHEPGLIELGFLYLGCVWLADEIGLSLRRALPWLLGAAFLVEIMQAWQPGRQAHLAGPMIVIASVLLVRARRALLPAGVMAGFRP